MNALLIFIKNPALGKVKTRLARTVGDVAALAIYEELSAITRQNAFLLRGVNRLLFYSDFVDNSDAWANDTFQKDLQIAGDLGKKMQHAFETAFQKGNKKAVIIGSDCPTLTTAILEQAFENLDNHDFTVGPSTDGGYYLLGIRAGVDCAPLFQNIEWSTAAVLPTTLARITEGGYSYALLPELTDVDEEKDWLAFTQTRK
jgi:uncharacterized protein